MMSTLMDSNAPKPPDDLPPPLESPEPAPAAGTAGPAAMGSPWVWASACVVGAALVAGFLAWGIGERTYDYYRPSEKARSGRDFKELNRETGIADQKNATIVFGTFGAVLGLFFGTAGGALRRSIPAGASAAVAGMVLGGIGAGLVGYVLAPMFTRFFSNESPSLLLPILVRGGIWAVAGVAAGLALGWGWRGFVGIPGMGLGGLAGSLCGTIAFEVVNAVLFPAERNDAAIPSSMQARLLACFCVAVGVALGTVLFGHPSSPTASRSFQTQR
jgi:hypothetical protein